MAGTQSGTSSTVCASVQLGELPPATGAAVGGEALVADYAAGQADQDRCEGGASRTLQLVLHDRELNRDEFHDLCDFHTVQHTANYLLTDVNN